jgi:C4-dicarboxylate-specific signal transduction histidine kinase
MVQQVDHDALTRLQDELISIQRLALLGTTAAMIAHEFNNLMTPVLARAQDALARDDAAGMRKALERTVTQVQKAIAITQQLMTLADGGQYVPRRCPLAAAVRDAVASTARPLERDSIELQIDVTDDVHVLADPLLLEQVLLNLVLNARAAMKGRGGRLTIAARADAGRVVIDVSDNGPGIPRDRVTSVVNPFLESPAAIEPGDWRGVGLGLNVCRTIAQRHGATIECLINESAGCTFRLRWPEAH